MSFNFIKNTTVTLIIMLSLDLLWMKLFAGAFYAGQFSEIGRFTEAGDFDIHFLPAVLAYVLMAFALEYFVLSRPGSMREQLLSGALLGLCLFGVYDLTNRAILENYSMALVLTDMTWGVVLYTTTTAINVLIRQSIFFLK